MDAEASMEAADRLHAAANDPTYSRPRVRREDIFFVVTALTVARTLRATAEAERAHYEALWVAMCAERDTALARQNRLECLLEVVTLKHQDALQRATRLDALEAAARAWASYRAIARDPKTEPDAYWANTRQLIQAESALAAAVAALDGGMGAAG